MKVNSRNISNISQQKGWTMWSLMFVLGVVGLFAYIGFQLVPVYSTNNNIKNAMRITLDNTDPRSVGRSGVISKMNSQLVLDGAFGVIDFKKDLAVKRTQRELILKINYEKRIPLFFNLSLVASFENEAKRDL